MKRTFKGEYDDIVKYIEKKGMGMPFDNLMGLTHLDMMVDAIIPTPELQADLHEHIQGLIKGMLEFVYEDDTNDDTLIGYV